MPANIPSDASYTLRLYLLGDFRALAGSQAIPSAAWGLRRSLRLIKLLALAPRYTLHREQVVDLLWPNQTLENPDNSLHQTLYAARRALSSVGLTVVPYLQLRGDLLTLATEPSAIWVDVTAFEAAAAQAHSSRDPSAYAAALDLYGGSLLPEDQYESWASGRAEILQREYLRLLVKLAQFQESARAYDEGAATLQRAVEVDPTSEDAQISLMRLLALGGKRAEALRRYETLRRALKEELGVEPQATSTRLFEDIVAGRFPPQSIQLVTSSPEDEKARLSNLPAPMNRFIGRKRDLAEIQRLFDSARIITIAGPGGSGKTRLAIEAATVMMSRFPHGAWLVELAGIERPAAIPQVLAAALRVIEQPGRPLISTVTAALAARPPLLLLLDNCEHLIDACAELAESLLRACPDLRLLCTSREPLHISGEVVWRLSSLGLPDARAATSLESTLSCESVRLFVDRARTQAPAFALNAQTAPSVIQICQRLDGLPLAIELAAVRVGTLPVERIAKRLDDCLRALGRGARTSPTRQQTLAATLDWSYSLLSEREQHLFRRLAVFPAGFDLEAAEWISAAGSAPDADTDALDTLTSLIDKSLVVMDEHLGGARYRLLEPLRQYAERLLKERGELLATCARRRDWSLLVTERTDTALWGKRHTDAVARLEANYGAVGASLEWLLRDDREIQAGARLVASLWQFWLLSGMFSEGRHWMERLLSRATEPSTIRADTLLSLFSLAIRQGEYATSRARDAIKQSVTIYRDLGDARGIGRAMRMAGVQACMTGELERAGEAFHASLALAQEANDVNDQGLALHSLGALAYTRSAYAAASDYLESALALFRAEEHRSHGATVLQNFGLVPFSDKPDAIMTNEETWVLLRAISASSLIGYTLAHLGVLARAEGDLTRARGRLEESVVWFRRHGDHAGLAQALGRMGALARVQGDFARAHTLLAESLSLRRQLGERRDIGMAVNNLALVAMAEGHFARAHTLLVGVLEQFVELGDGSGIEMTRDLQAQLALCEGDHHRAYELYIQSLAEHRAMGHDPLNVARALANLGAVSQASGDYTSAQTHTTEALAIYQQIGDERAVSRLRRRLGEIAPTQGSAGGNTRRAIRRS